MKPLYRYIWRHSSKYQLATCLLALASLPLALAPIELQRRIIDDAIGEGDKQLLIWLIVIYAAAIVTQQVIKFTYNIVRTRVAEIMIRTLREKIVDNVPSSDAESEDGELVSVLTAEVEPVGAFAGDAYAQLVTEGGVLLSILGYMLYTEFWLAWIAIIAFIPQVIATPYVQNYINDNSKRRIKQIRAVGDDVLAVKNGEGSNPQRIKRRIGLVFGLRIVINKLKFGLKAILNLSDHFADLAVLSVGGFMVIAGESEIGIVIAFLSGLGRLRDPWRTLITYFRVASDAQVRFGLLKDHL